MSNVLLVFLLPLSTGVKETVVVEPENVILRLMMGNLFCKRQGPNPLDDIK
jgi:hypothetical protein